MTRLNLIDHLTSVLTKAGETDDSRLDRDYLGYLIDNYRSKEIRDTYRRNPNIDPIWLQDYGVFDLTNIDRDEDTSISVCDCEFSKATLPPLVSIVDPRSSTIGKGMYRVQSACGSYEYYPTTLQKLYLAPEGSVRTKFKHYVRVGNALYLTPEVNKARVVAVFEKPLESFVLQTEKVVSGDLVALTSYTVVSGNVTHSGTVYGPGQVATAIFTAVTTTFTGNGIVKYTNDKRAMTNNDEYPMSATMSEVVIMKILTNEYGVERGVVSDIIDDSRDQFQVVSGS
jgi:hypothetical protein